jgi:hypothetical protein
MLAPTIETWSIQDGSGMESDEPTSPNMGNGMPEFMTLIPNGVQEGNECFEYPGYLCGPGLYCGNMVDDLGSCEKVGYGYYSPDASNVRMECSNPEGLNKRYLNDDESTNNCEWLCADPKHQAVEVEWLWECIEIPVGYYLPPDSNDPLPCTMPLSYPLPFYEFISNAVDDSCEIGAALQSYASIDQVRHYS